MAGRDFTTAITVDKSPKEVFIALTNVRGWWSEEVVGDTDRPGAVFSYHYRDAHRCRLKIVGFIPEKKIVWYVLENYFDFVKDQTEWDDTEICFDIMQKGDKTELQFTHRGLVPGLECYDVCADAWTRCMNGSIRNLITTGTGNPHVKEKASPREPSPRNIRSSTRHGAPHA